MARGVATADIGFRRLDLGLHRALPVSRDASVASLVSVYEFMTGLVGQELVQKVRLSDFLMPIQAKLQSFNFTGSGTLPG